MKKFIALIFTALFAAGAWAHENEATVNGVKWYYNRISDGKGGYNAEITYRGNYDSEYSNEYSGSLTIPSTLGGYSVTSIRSYAFYGCSSLTSVTIPDSVTTIGRNAFYDCSSLTSVTIPNSVTTIGGYAFYGTPFYNNQPDGFVILGGCLYKYKGTCPSSVTIPEGVTEIGYSAFYGCSSLTSVTIPDSVTSIGSSAFYGCSSLTSVTIPDGVTEIGSGAFYGCSSLKEIIGWRPGCPTNVKRIVISDSVTMIGYNAFSGCSSLTSVTIPNSVMTIGSGAFSDCSSLTSITIPGSVTEIGSWAFYCCSSLTSVTIPNSVTTIGDLAFYGCSSLASVTIPDSVTTIGDYAFEGCSSLTSVTIPSGVTTIGEWAFSDCSSLTSITIPEGVTTIGERAFLGCSSLASVTIPDSVTTIGERAFLGCSSLTSVTIPEGVTTIGWDAFCDCSSLKEFVVGENNSNYRSINGLLCTKDGKRVVFGVNGDVMIPDGVTEIGSGAFYGCSSLASVTIPDGVTTIGEWAFAYCSSLTSITIPGSVTELGSGEFYDCSSLTSVTIGNSVTTIGERAFYGCSSLTSVTIPNSVTTIRERAFQGCSLLRQVTIPDSVTMIGNDVFSYCGKLESVVVEPNSTLTPDSSWGVAISKIVMQQDVKVVVHNQDISQIYDGCVHQARYNLECECIDFDLNNIKYIGTSIAEIQKVGAVKSPIANSDFEYTGDDIRFRNVVIECVDEEVSINIVPRSVRLISRSASKCYDRQPLVSVQVIIEGDGFVTGECSVVALGSQTNVGMSKNAVAINWAEGASADNYDISIQEGELTVLPRSVSITSGSASKVYDGTPLTASYLVGGDGFVDGECALAATSSRTTVGLCKNEVTLNWAEGASADNYDISIQEGELTVLPRGVSITSGSASKVYDGTPLTASYSIGGGGFVDGECDVSVSSRTAAGSSKNEVSLSWAEGASADNYDISIQEGELTVLPRSVSITSDSASKVYDGTPLTASYSVGGDGFVTGECDVSTSSRTIVGSTKNEVTLNWAEGASADNYAITIKEGTLTITPAKVPRIATTAFSTTYSYDGEEHTINVAGVETTTLIDPPRFSYALSAEGPWQDEAPTFKDAGRHTVWYKISADNYEDYIQEACVTILPRKLVVASVDVEKFYDGVPLKGSAVEFTTGKLVEGESFSVDWIGYQLDEGESQNTFDIVWNGSAKESNYEVLKDYGTLKVTRLFGDVGDDAISFTYPYSYKSLTEVSFTEGVEEVLASQFYGCVSLQSVKFPDSLRVIDCHALDGLPNVEWQIIDGYKMMDGWIFGYTEDAADEISNVDDIRGIAAGALEGCKALKRFVCTKNAKLKTINARAFKDMYWLEEVSLPDSLLSIGDSAFEGCTELYTISFGNGLRDIEAAAFRDCITLETISFGEGLMSIGTEAFSATADTMRLKSVSLPATLQSIGRNAFKGCELIRGATTPSGILAAKDLFPDAYTNMTSYAVSEGSAVMVDAMFKDCACLSTILLPESLTQIGESAFEDCQSLIEIGLPDAVTTLGRYAFRNCYNLKTIGLPKELNAIEDGTFVNCPMLDSLIVPESVKRIGSQIYSGGTWYSLDADPSILDKAEKPYSSYRMETRQGVEAIWYRFENVSRLKAVYFLGDAPEVDSSIYVGTPNDLTSYVIKGSTGWYREGAPTLPTSGWPTIGTARAITYWQPNIFDVVFEANGGLPETYSLQQITDTTYSLPKVAPSREGYLFDGWWTERIDGARITANSRVTAKNAHTLYAHWSQRTDMVTVRFNPNGGTVSPDEVAYNLNVTYGSLPVPTRIGHIFVGWHTSPIGGSEIIEASMVDKVVNELYAHWKPITYIVRFNANGAIGQSYQQEHTYNASDKLSLNTFTKEGFAFVGWSLTPGGSADFANNQEVENLGEVQDQVVDLYAVWKAATYAVRFDGNGGAGNMANQTHNVGSSQTLSKQQFKRIGYIFSGWATTPTGNVVYGDEESVSNLTFVNNATVVLYAVWTPGSYSIVYHANDGTQSSFSESAIWDRDYVIADNRFVRDGYDFVGWAVGDDGAVAYMPMMNVRNIAEDAGDQVCLYAVWEKSAAVDPTNVVFTNGGDADWQRLAQLVVKTEGTHSVATPVVWQSGKIADNQSSILKTKVSGKGKFEFWWRVSCESFRTQKLDHLSFMVDGDEVKWINGEKDWAYFEHEILTSGEHEIAWAYNKDDMESGGEDCGAVCAVVWTPRLTNLADYLNADELAFSTSGDAEWFGTTEVTHDGAGAAQSGKIGDNQESRLETTVDGSGTIAFWWKVDCESYRTYKLDYVAFSIDGVEQKWINGNKDWMRESFEVSGAGAHTLAWVYAKDEEGSDGVDCAWVDEIVWTPALAPMRPEAIESASDDVKDSFDKWIAENAVSDPSAANVNAFILGLAPDATEEAIQEQVEAEIENIDMSKLATDPAEAVEAIQAKYPNAKVELVPVEGLKTSAHLYKLVIELK